MTIAVSMLLALVVHEWAHAYVARTFGDDTAEMAGRWTLNPIPHIHPLLTVALPLVTAWLWVPVGSGKPIPLSPLRLSKGEYMVALFAGPAANVILAVISFIVALFCLLFVFPTVGIVAVDLARVNAAMALFNLLPLPWLDGGRMLRIAANWR